MYALTLENENGNILNINDEVRYIVTSVSGTNPPPASIFTVKSPNRKGSKYNGSTLNERNLIISIKLLGDIEANRATLYDWCDTEQYVKVRLRNGVRNVYCEGHIEDCEIDPYVENEVAKIAIICENPYWHDLEAIRAELSALLAQFKFPFAIESAGVPFSTIRENFTTTIFNAGAETGIKIIINCRAELKNPTLYNGTDTTQQFRLDGIFPEGSIIEINTEGSPKTCRLIRPDGTTKNLLKHIRGRATWFQLKKGSNVFGYTAESGGTDAEIFINFTTKYKGV